MVGSYPSRRCRQNILQSQLTGLGTSKNKRFLCRERSHSASPCNLFKLNGYATKRTWMGWKFSLMRKNVFGWKRKTILFSMAIAVTLSALPLYISRYAIKHISGFVKTLVLVDEILLIPWQHLQWYNADGYLRVRFSLGALLISFVN